MIYILFLGFIVSNAYYNFLVINSNQDWHYLQILNIVYLLSIGFENKNSKKHILNLIGFSLIYPFLFNTTLNVFRNLPINHLGVYDFISFPLTVILFVLGLIYILFINSYIKYD